MAKQAKKKAERVAFQMHPRMLYDIVCRQAGTLAKAILEGVMNAGDAKATQCRVSISEGLVIIRDNGQGMTNEEHVRKRFATFGQPHDPTEEKIYGTFRMGRGQMFSFGVNQWKTGTFRMNVDFKNCPEDEAGFDFITDAEPYDGCVIRIRLYQDLLPSDVAETIRMLQHWCKYAPFEVYVNDELVSTDPEEEKWDHVLDEAYIKLQKTGVLSIYNLGVHTMDLSNHRFGTGGVVVSRKQLKVNFARNDVQSDCPVWKKVKPLVDQFATERNVTAKSLDEGARKRLVDQFVRGQIPWNDFRTRRVFTTVNGRHYDIHSIYDHWSYNKKITVAPKGHPLADKLFQRKVAFILAEETLERFECKDVPALLTKLHKLVPSTFHGELPKYVPFEQLTKGLDTKYILLNEKDLRPNEIVWLRLMDSHKYSIRLHSEENRYKYQSGGPSSRRIIIGHSDQANGWTDGQTYVAIARQFLAELQFDVPGYNEVGRLLLHEFCHDDVDTAEHEHTMEFYQLFHDSSRSIGNFVDDCVTNIAKVLDNEGRKLSKRQLRLADKVAKGNKSEEEFQKLAADSK